MEALPSVDVQITALRLVQWRKTHRTIW